MQGRSFTLEDRIGDIGALPQQLAVFFGRLGRKAPFQSSISGFLLVRWLRRMRRFPSGRALEEDHQCELYEQEGVGQ